MPGFAPVDPKQSFPDLEQRTLERWREQDLFARSLAERADAPIWSFYDGPPTANGRPGSHHVLARVFTDIYPRYRTMCGYLRAVQDARKNVAGETPATSIQMGDEDGAGSTVSVATIDSRELRISVHPV